jgi:hypothetical protein
MYKSTAAGGQFICLTVQQVQAKCVCCTCVRTAFYRVAVIFLEAPCIVYTITLEKYSLANLALQ